MNSYSVPMHRAVVIIFVLAVAIVAGVVVWCFRSGIVWSGICTIAVAGPLTIMYWYMLMVNPARTSIVVGEEGISIEAPPFTKAMLLKEDIRRVFTASLEDETLAIEKLDGAMRFGGYKNGRFLLAGGKKAVILSNKSRVVGIETDDALYLLGPADFDAFAEEATAFGA